ncbi:MAG: PAS domain-containing protein [Pseudomonadota bacterium]|nr:PAS domain-containing protein [Pseudomonadota bacterium]
MAKEEKGRDPSLTGVERTFGNDEIIVSKTNPKGIITYANELFLKIADYRQDEVLGKPHNVIRHPHMPKAVFKLLWDALKDGQEIFAYVVNRTKYGDHYWVLAHVTPSFDDAGSIIGLHSNRRSPRREAISVIEPLYRQLKAIEDKASTPREAVESSYNALTGILQEKGISYDQFVLSL